MPVVLIGPPGAGKTTVGRRVAKALGLPFTDTDRVIVQAHGSIADIFREHGEPRFRELERAAVATALADDGVVSLGGGAVLDPATRADLEACRVVLLTVSEHAVRARIRGDDRPLVDGLDSWRRIVADREELYRSLADLTIDTSDRPLPRIAGEIERFARERQP
ncbi:shikimate kinase [Clavibacter sepedonicus]|uniref:Shikimate kinase n=1 Tax=Clavibacter sepedonicus TaxID=31964 RepID=B0REK7_CLASE|nr:MULTISPECIES: shikimate kinase [Clavibacter]MBD5383231.1 shikimate kinase [Clavibacter sp.]OQJ49225.1 shikimate kinase [Clavibacter sepedonicus]OQJ54837.1 shikimate kinase [Clavibacter sepedonicus]UUK64936.1 shikimate kinase [Clavibacter sepedonicus]CAQ00854.1 shikimate kinase I [Clavibacter sepedonicus]